MVETRLIRLEKRTSKHRKQAKVQDRSSNQIANSDSSPKSSMAPQLGHAEVSSITLLINQARKGDEQARSEVLKKLQPWILSIAAQHHESWLQKKHGVSDIVQQSYLKVIEHFDSFAGSSSNEFRGWLKKLVINEIRQLSRNLNRKRRDVKRERSLNTSGQRDFEGIEQSPSTKAIQKEQLEQLKHILSQLEPLTQHVIQLRAFEHLTFREIGKRLDRSQDSVTKIWYRALIQLQKQMSENEPEQSQEEREPIK